MFVIITFALILTTFGQAYSAENFAYSQIVNFYSELKDQSLEERRNLLLASDDLVLTDEMKKMIINGNEDVLRDFENKESLPMIARVLHAAIKSENVRLVIKILVENNQNKKALVNIKDKNGFNCFHMSAIKGNLAISRLVANAGCNVNAVDLSKRTPLYFATELHKFEVLKHLIESNANIDAVDFHRRTALHVAVQVKNIEAFEYLLKSGADIEAKDHFGQTALDYANMLNLNDFANLILPYKDELERQSCWDARKNCLLTCSFRREIRLVQPVKKMLK